MVREALKRDDIVETYLTMCPNTVTYRSSANVIEAFSRLKPFEFLTETEEREIQKEMEPREFRPLAILSNGTIYLGQWRIGTDIKEGRGVLIDKFGSITESYFVNDTS